VRVKFFVEAEIVDGNLEVVREVEEQPW